MVVPAVSAIAIGLITGTSLVAAPSGTVLPRAHVLVLDRHNGPDHQAGTSVPAVDRAWRVFPSRNIVAHAGGETQDQSSGGVLRSKLFTEADEATRQKLEACAAGQPNESASHFKVGHANGQGEHIRRVQQALKNVQLDRPELGIPSFDVSGTYDATFARAVHVYKEKRDIRNYADQIDDIVGMKTLRQLDSDNVTRPHVQPNRPAAVSVIPREVSAALAGISPVPNHQPLKGGVWSGSATVSVLGGQSMTFVLKNTSILGASIKITDHLGASHSQLLLPGQTAQMQFSNLRGEPVGWTFTVTTDSDAFVVAWQLWSTWVPGDPVNR